MLSCGAVDSLRPDRTIGPHMNLAYFANDACLNQFHCSPNGLTGMRLVTHLSDDSLFSGNLGHQACLMNGVSQGLLAIAMLSHAHGHDAGNRMCVVGGADGHCIDPFFLLEHHPEILVALGFWEFFEGFGRAHIIDVTECNNLCAFPGRVVDLSPSFSANSNSGDVNPLIGSENAAGKELKGQGSGGSGFHEAPTGNGFFHDNSSNGNFRFGSRSISQIRNRISSQMQGWDCRPLDFSLHCLWVAAYFAQNRLWKT